MENKKAQYTPTLDEALQKRLNELRQTTMPNFDNLKDEQILQWHKNFWMMCANDILKPQGREFVIDENNRSVILFLLYYFNMDERALEVFPEKRYDLHKGVMLIGEVGAGKTLIMQAFERYLRMIKSPLAFRSTSVTEILNYYKVNEHIDYFTYNVGKNSTEGHPVALCINDVGLQTQKYFGNDMQVFVDELFHARNEVYVQHALRTHLTTNFGPKEMKAVFEDAYGRLNDRWNTYNVLKLPGKSRRKQKEATNEN